MAPAHDSVKLAGTDLIALAKATDTAGLQRQASNADGTPAFEADGVTPVMTPIFANVPGVAAAEVVTGDATMTAKVTDDAGKVTGVIVKGEGGYEQYNCAKGVVLATGGYEFNQQMLKERCRPRGVPGAWLTGAFGNTGDGLQMALPWALPRTSSRSRSCWIPSSSCPTCA